MEQLMKRMLMKLFPELFAGYHLPMFGQVIGVREAPKTTDICDEFRPKYAVDVQVLTEKGEPDPKWDILTDVIMSLPVAGHEMGQFAYPEDGTWVELAFAYGSPQRPFIRSVLPNGLTMPAVERGEQRWQHNPASFQRVDKDGNWERKTDLTINEESLERFIEAMSIVETYHVANKETATNDTEITGAIKTIKAFGAIVVQSGGILDLSAVAHLRLTTKADALVKTIGKMQSNIGTSNKVTAGQDNTLEAGTKNNFQAPKTWIGTSEENGLRLMSDLAQLVIELAEILAQHTHPSTGQITQSSQVTNIATLTTAIKGRIDGIAE